MHRIGQQQSISPSNQGLPDCSSIQHPNEITNQQIIQKRSQILLDTQNYKPIVSKSTINQRMFRSKPYTKCIECLNDQGRLRCPKCMETIIDDISKSNQPKRVFRIKHKQAFGMSTNRLAHHQGSNQGMSGHIFRRNLADTNHNFMDSSHKNKEQGKYRPCQTVSSSGNTSKEYQTTALHSKDQKTVKQNRNKSQKILITSKYSYWLNQKLKKRQNFNSSSNFYSTSATCWPRKTKNHDYNLQKYGAKQPKFEKWQKKLLDQLLSKTKKLR